MSSAQHCLTPLTPGTDDTAAAAQGLVARARSKAPRVPLLACDLAAGLLSQALALFVAARWDGPAAHGAAAVAQSVLIASLLIGVILVHLGQKGRYRAQGSRLEDGRRLILASASALAMLALAAFLSHSLASQGPALLALGLFPLLATGSNCLLRSILSRAGACPLPVLLIGQGAQAEAVEAALCGSNGRGYRFLGRLDPREIDLAEGGAGLRQAIAGFPAAHLLFALDDDLSLQQRLIAAALRERLCFGFAVDAAMSRTVAAHDTRFLGHEALIRSIRHCLRERLAEGLTATAEKALAAALLLLASPLLACLALISRLAHVPFLLGEPRLGQGGRVFPCLRFGLLAHRGEALGPRLPPFAEACANLLHRSRFGDLPLLLHVLRGQMSFVGAAALSPEAAASLGEALSDYVRFRPGITEPEQPRHDPDPVQTGGRAYDRWSLDKRLIRLDLRMLTRGLGLFGGRRPGASGMKDGQAVLRKLERVD